ncbi:MAG: ankyrin repeat domain-containing protein [Gammaproteobacteria bacterium]
MNFDSAVAAIQAGDAKQLAAILKARPDMASGRTAQGVSLYMVAAYHHQPALLTLIRAHLKVLDAFEATAGGELKELRQRLETTPESLIGWSPDGFNLPQLAAFFDQPDVLRELVQRGADIAVPSRNPMRVHAINAAAAGGSLECVEILLNAGADCAAAAAGRYHPLMSAAHRGDEPMCQVLMKYGADTAQQNDDGKTAADFAREAGHEHIAALLSG